MQNPRASLAAAVAALHSAAAAAGPPLSALIMLASRIWLAQSVFLHQVMMMMRADHAPSVGDALIRAIAPALLAFGLATRPIALLLLLGIGVAQPDYALGPQQALLIWLVIAGAGPLSIDHLLRGGLSRIPLFAARLIGDLYVTLTRIGQIWLPFATRLFIALGLIATHPNPVLLLPAAALILGLLVRPTAAVLWLLAPPMLFAGTQPDRMETALLLLLLIAHGAGPFSLDALAASRLARRTLKTPQHDLPHVVVVGGGFGGIATVRALRHTACRITLVDQRNYHLFQPLLYQVATAALSPADIAVPIRSLLRNQPNAAVQLGQVTGIDPATRTVQLAAARLPFDYLVLATGARHSYFGHAEWASAAPGLKSIEDATAMRSLALLAFERAENEPSPAERAAWLTFVVVGGGPAGVELAGALMELARGGLMREYRAIDPASARVILMQSAPRLLPAFAPSLSAEAARALTALGVEVRTESRVTRIDGGGVDANNERIPARTVFWTAGVKASPAAEWLKQPADPAGRIPVYPDLSVPDRPGIFAIGDTAASLGWNGKPVPGLAPAAKQQGAYVAAVIRAALERRPAPPPFRYRHFGNLATIGRLAAVAEYRSARLWGAPAWWFWGLAHVALLAGGRNRLIVLLNWLWAYLTYGRGIRLITSEPAQ